MHRSQRKFHLYENINKLTKKHVENINKTQIKRKGMPPPPLQQLICILKSQPLILALDAIGLCFTSKEMCLLQAAIQISES